MRWFLLAAIAAAAVAVAAASAAPPEPDVRFATFNASLNRPSAGLLTTHLADPNVDDQFRRQAKNVAEVIQRIHPDVLLVNEFDPLGNADAPVAGPETSCATTSSRSPRTVRRRSSTRTCSSRPRTRASRRARI